MVTPDLAEFKERLREILPREPIEVRTANDGVILSGRVSGARKVARALELAERYAPGRVTNLMMVGGSQQVMLKVRFAEMSRDVSKNLSSGLTAQYTDPDVTLGAAGNSTGTSFPITAAAGGSVGAAFSLGDVAIDMLISALEAKGMSRVLAEPNLVAVSGESASFLAGGEFPVPTDAGDGKIAVEFKPFGITLDFTPVVIDDDLIRLELDTEVSEPRAFGENTGVNASSASTQVELRDGQSFAIAGLLQDSFSDGIEQTPWLGDIPILGALFRSTSYTRRQSELVIIITAYLVSPTDGDLLALPTDRMRIPTEMELFLGGKVEGSTVVRDVARQDFQGSYGYVME